MDPAHQIQAVEAEITPLDDIIHPVPEDRMQPPGLGWFQRVLDLHGTRLAMLPGLDPDGPCVRYEIWSMARYDCPANLIRTPIDRPTAARVVRVARKRWLSIRKEGSSGATNQ